MSLLKWTLAMAGTAMTVRYLSDRHRQRLASGGDLAPQMDRDAASGGMGGPTQPGMDGGLTAGSSTGSSLSDTGLGNNDTDPDTDTLSPGGGGLKGFSSGRL